MGSFGRVNFEEKRQELDEQVAVPSWCTVDCKLGSLSVKLDFPQVFACELYANEAGFPRGPDYDEQKVNVGLRICRSLFRSALPSAILCHVDAQQPLLARLEYA